MIATKQGGIRKNRPYSWRQLRRFMSAYVFLSIFAAMSGPVLAAGTETWHYGLDDVGNITSRGTGPLPANATHNYTYDGLYRLTDETNPDNT
ncbi:MAG: hypothetical protein GY814_14690, partial [Gammaproteobacteria bacterium]|nr:hypothetical protein [Gammaproteobacteria bacterium]